MGHWNRDKTHCKRGHELAGANLYYREKRGQRHCRACAAEARVRYRRKRGEKPRGPKLPREGRKKREQERANFLPQTVSKIIAGLEGGQSLKSLRIDGPKFRNFCRKIEIGPRLVRLAENNAREAMRRNGLESARNFGVVGALPITLPTSFWNDGHRNYEAARVATQNIPWPSIREEIISDILAAVYEGTLRIEDAAAHVKLFMKARNKREQHSVTSRWGNLSLDAPLYDSDASRYDFIAEDQRLWA